MKKLLAVLLGLGLAADAHALDPYMWGVGPRLGTMVIPGRYPLRLPGDLADDSTIARVRHDLTVGAEGTYYINSFTRMLLDAGLGFGSGFFDAHFLVKWNYVTQTGAMDFLAGAGVGFGTATWRGDEPEKLNVPYYPLRAEASALIRDDTRGYQGTIYGQYAIPANHFYTTPGGDEGDVGIGVYLTVGIEIAVLFGDFTPPRPRGRSSD